MKIFLLVLAVLTLAACKKQPRVKVQEEVDRLNAQNKSKCAFWRVGGPPNQQVPVFDQSRCHEGDAFNKAQIMRR